MKKFLLTILVICGLFSCTNDDSEMTEMTGSIYGIITVKETAEPMRATGVELYTYSSLYTYGSLLLKTVTYDDGHYEFENLTAGQYVLKVVATGYEDASYRVIVEPGRMARADMQLKRINTYMTVRTLFADIRGDKATLNGEYEYYGYNNPNKVGFIYSDSPTPNIGGTTITSSITSPFSNVISNLKKGKYYFQAYATNNYGTEYGEIQSFEINGQPTVTTLDATNVEGSTATLNGCIDYEGDPAYTKRGFVYSSSYPNPTVDDPVTITTNVVVSGKSKEFSANIAGLSDDITYYARAYVISSAGVVYGEAIEFSNSEYIVLKSDGIMVHKYDVSSGVDWNTANNLCKSSKIGGYSDWRLPTLGECYAMAKQAKSLNLLSSTYYWTSTAYSSTYYYCFYFPTSEIDYCKPTNEQRVRGVRTIK